MIADRVGALALLAAVAVPGFALAQAYGAPPQPPGAEGAARWAPGAGRGDMRQARQEREAQKLKALHDVLRIRPDQESAFQAYAAALRPPAHGDGAAGAAPMHHERGEFAQMTTPQRLDAMAKRMDERVNRMRARFQHRADATKALYAALSPDQQRTLDALPELEGRAGHGGGKGEGMGRGPHGGMPPMGPPPPPPQG
jgi:hypothetical protein